jgi:hypothetical protein
MIRNGAKDVKFGKLNRNADDRSKAAGGIDTVPGLWNPQNLWQVARLLTIHDDKAGWEDYRRWF